MLVDSVSGKEVKSTVVKYLVRYLVRLKPDKLPLDKTTSALGITLRMKPLSKRQKYRNKVLFLEIQKCRMEVLIIRMTLSSKNESLFARVRFDES